MDKPRSEFFERVLKSSPLDFSKITAEQRKEMEEVNWNHICDLDGPRSIKRRPSPREIWWHQRLFYPFAAIQKSYDILQDVEVYVRRFPYRGTRVSPATYLRHNIQVYFQETYILRQRMIDFLNSLEKDYAGSSQGVELKTLNARLCGEVKRRLKPITDARKQHVHELGYDDNGLSRLDTLELLAVHTAKKENGKKSAVLYRIFYEDGYKGQRKRWRELIRQWNTLIGTTLDEYFENLNRVVFTQSGELIFPQLFAN